MKISLLYLISIDISYLLVQVCIEEDQKEISFQSTQTSS